MRVFVMTMIIMSLQTVRDWAALPDSIILIISYTFTQMTSSARSNMVFVQTKVREKSRECRNHKPQPFPDTKRKRKPTNPNKHKPNKRTKSTKISSLFPKRNCSKHSCETQLDTFTQEIFVKKSKRKVQGVPQSQIAALHKPQTSTMQADCSHYNGF